MFVTKMTAKGRNHLPICGGVIHLCLGAFITLSKKRILGVVVIFCRLGRNVRFS
jgi:hypothetical protein